MSRIASSPVSFNAAVAAFSSQAPFSSLSPIFTVSASPAATSADLNDRPCLVRKSLALSQSENVLHGPTNRWKLQVAGGAVTVIGVLVAKASSAGLT